MTDSYRRPRSNATLLVVVLVGAVLLTSLATPVAAHAYLSETDPANGEQVDSLPDEVTLYFSGDGVVNADITVEDPDGEVVSEEPQIDPDDTQIVRVPIDDDAAGDDGMYAVEWEVLADDGHTTSGSFFFAVGDEPLDRDAVLEAYEDDEADESIPPIEAGAKALLLVGVVGLLGIPAVATLAVRPVFARADAPVRSRVDGRIGRLLVGAAGLTLVGAIGLGLARSTALGPLSLETISQFVETPLGEAWIVQVALAVCLTGLAAAAARGVVAKRVSSVAAFGGALAVAGTIAWTSHSATAIDRFQGAAVDFAHLLGAGLWAGGLAVLALVVVPAIRNAKPDDRADLLARTIGRFSILAFIGVTLVVASGFVLASWHVPTADGLTETTYGLTLVAKLALAAVALGLGGLSRFVLLPRLAADRRPESADGPQPASTDGGVERSNEDRSVSTFARSVRLEVALLVVVVVLSGVLTSAPTAAVADGDDLVESTIEYEYDDHLVEVTAFPAAEETAGDTLVLESDEPIVFEVAFLDDDGETVASDQPVRLLASSEDGTEFEVELEEIDDGAYAVVQPLSDEGTWEIRITGAPEGSYVSEWVDAVVVPADDHDHAEDHDHEGHAEDHDHTEDHDHADHPEDHDHEEHAEDRTDEAEATVFQTLLQFGAVVTVIGGVIAVALESVRLRDGRFD
ncbi:copper resistance protein CopC [Natrarchaeobius sp. A-rgal3]|uniref:copper resistance CopC/CopD family protein n=1 Tax=Natrarchaeobius versutus TaxID=1679078 RepID=UPI00350EE3B4